MRLVRRAFGTLAAVLLTGCASVPQSPLADGRSSLQYTDLTDDFAALYDGASAFGEAERVQHIRQGMAANIPGFYGPERLEETEERYNRWMAEYLTHYPEKRKDIAAVSARFSEMFHPAVADFETRLGKLPDDTSIALVIAMGEFDGGTRELNGQPFLLFGADMIAEIHHGEARAFLQHELAHIYHDQYFEHCAELWCSLWSEGLAVHIADVLNPAATDGELLRDLPEPIRPALAEHRSEAICTTIKSLDSTSPDDFAAILSFDQMNERLPARYGYLVGAWVAEDLGRGHSLQELNQMTGPDLRTAIETSLRSMTNCE